MPETLEHLGYGFVAWRTRQGWSAAHVVVGADTAVPGDCGGYYTACRRIVPEAALEYATHPQGSIASRPFENTPDPLVNYISRMAQGLDGDMCVHCRRLLQKEGSYP
jgi:hypothetical protein